MASPQEQNPVPSNLKSDFLSHLAKRGYIHQCTNYETLDEKFASGKVVAYCGYDCTADSLHVGSLLSIMVLRHLQKCGHKPIVLMGGGTTKVGDPSGKDDARQLISEEKINENMDGIKKIFEQFITFGDGPTDAVMVNNAEWLDKLEYINFLRDYGRHFSVNRMLGFESVKQRLDREQPLSFLEFNYMILQAYDFLELSRRYDCNLQFGGSDQWGNIVNGTDLTRRVDGNEIYGLTTPLLTTSSGAKMGKSAAGAVWLNEDRLSHFDYFQFWRNAEDGDVGRFMRLFTDLSDADIAKYEAMEGADINEAKKVLAFEATRMCRGEEAALAAKETARKTFEEGSLAEDLPTFEFSQASVEAGDLAIFALMASSGLVGTNSEGRRMIKGGGARLNGDQVKADSRMLSLEDFDDDGFAKLSAGKKKHALLKLV